MSTTFRNPDQVFSEFFGGGRSSGVAAGPSVESIHDVFGGQFGLGPRKGAVIERKLPCSLEELYKGTTKKIQVSRTVFLSTGRSTTVEEVLKIEIKPGWKKGTKVTFPEKGNEEHGVIPSDLVIIVDEKPHALFKRDGNDLIVTQDISIVEALTGYTVQLATLDGRNITIPINNVIRPTHEELVEGEGMPISREPSKKGNLRIKFNINFPTILTPDQKTLIKRAFTSY